MEQSNGKFLLLKILQVKLSKILKADQMKTHFTLSVVHCNCSICVMKQNHHFIVPKEKFSLIKGQESLKEYNFNTGAAKYLSVTTFIKSHSLYPLTCRHLFCGLCGVQSFYIPRSNPDGVGVMPHCVTSNTIKSKTVIAFDGDNWEDSFEKDKTVKHMA